MIWFSFLLQAIKKMGQAAYLADNVWSVFEQICHHIVPYYNLYCKFVPKINYVPWEDISAVIFYTWKNKSNGLTFFRPNKNANSAKKSQ